MFFRKSEFTIDPVAAYHGTDRFAAALAPVKRGVAAQGTELVLIDREFQFSINNGYIGDLAVGKGVIFFKQNFRRTGGELGDPLRKGQYIGMDQFSKRYRNGGFQTDDAERCVIKFHRFARSGMGRMVCGDNSDSIISQTGDQRLTVGFRTQRRIHLVIGIKTLDALISQSDVVR